MLHLLEAVLFPVQEQSQFCGVDVAAGDDADDFAGGVAGEGARDGAGAGAFGDDVIVLN